MRKVLIDYARRNGAKKRGGAYGSISLDECVVFSPQKSSEIIALDEALNRLAQLDPRQSRIVELRYFGGLSLEETAAAVGLSTRQVEREWTIAKAWLHGELMNHA
jgi:RNA polymerase sigma factor (TIGR02999 family)